MSVQSPTSRVATLERGTTAVLIVRIGGRQYGLPLASIDRVLPMALVAPVPEAGDGVMGMLNLHGRVLPVIDPHPRLGVSSPAMAAEQRLVLVRGTTSYLLWVDDVEEVAGVHAEAFSGIPAAQADSVAPRVIRLGEAIVPLLAPSALEPRGSGR